MNPDKIHSRVVEGSPYERAKVTVRRVFPISLDRKVRLAVVTLAASVPLAPSLFLQRDLIRSIEGTESLATTLSLQFGVLALIGVITGFAAGVLLVRQKRVLRSRSLTDEAARRLVRIEDLLALILLHAALLVGIPTMLAAVGVVSPGTVETLYGLGVTVYQPAGAFRFDARLVSSAGGLLAVALAVLDRTVGSE